MKYRTVLLLLVLGLATACTTPVMEDKASGEFATQGLYPIRHSGFAEAHARRDAGLAKYREVDIQALDVSEVDIPNTVVAGTLRRDWEMTPQRQAALQQAWAQATGNAFSSYTKAVSGKGVLRIAAKLTRIAPAMATATTVGGALQSPGSSRDAIEISVEFRFYDGGDDSLLAVIRDSRTMTSVAMSRTAPIAMTLMFDSWAALLHTRVSGR
jgi:hypothetical protein